MVSTTEMRAVFSDRARIRTWLDVLAAQAEIQGRFGLIPRDCADIIARRAAEIDILPSELAQEAEQVGRPILPLVRRLAEACPGESGQWVHYHGTTQDILDTSAAVQQTRAMSFLQAALADLLEMLSGLAEAHAATPMAARTNGRHARPITFGFKVAGWAAEMARSEARLAQLSKRAICGQFGGATGSFSPPAPGSPDIRRALMQRLGLPEPDLAWHAARDRPAELVAGLALLSAGLGRLGADIGRMSIEEIGELDIRETDSATGQSSTMPHKRNPRDLETLGATASMSAGLPSAMLHAMARQLDERNGAGWIPEWEIVPQAFLLCSGGLAAAGRVLRSLVVKPDRMLDNLRFGWLGAEADRLTALLAPKLGERIAHDLIQDACGDQNVRDGTDPLAAAVTTLATARGLTMGDLSGPRATALQTGLAEQECLAVLGRLRLTAREARYA
ncbi:3-carboxy-cis,cis-muconate cycloisomerase [Jannaschia formosa]|nr:3-carboxy-cis,cis-muconate cycloisomerase [Jannaschia formosa]